MARPKHRRCMTCGVVTSRYAGTQNAGAFVVRRWITDAVNGEVSTVNGTDIRCTTHARPTP